MQLDNPVSNNIAAQIAAGKYLALQRYWEATPPDIVETAVDELARFVLNPGDAEDVLETIQKNAESVWKRSRLNASAPDPLIDISQWALHNPGVPAGPFLFDF